ncbi:MAG: DNA/RNA non-specific endonuclease [Prevotella sp.]|uniref:DNA/RNA non-specific endonuclease n=1 Tax=Prevotella sp. TaxID=59823 RepID=UPI002A322607|nr:DNA/RNA non-specific endonuclease [Prevotella sp.]MDD7317463.1 DNA/RNA non-specific endonuclease [Prevotellaceae bacterium]MDY4019201.1 DNA/RNA non-specific endonuclease [Prevotella sp.]
MTLRKLLALMAVVMIALSGCGGDGDEPTPGGGGTSTQSNQNKNVIKPGIPAEVARLEFPRLQQGGNNFVVVHSTADSYGVNYALEWDIDKKSQRWSCYQMRKGYQGNAGRYDTQVNGYPFDPELAKHNYYLEADYFYRSGFDHGHICPSADRQYSEEANYQTFFLSNMQPQYNLFNAGIWEKLESKIRKAWVPTNNTDVLYVCKGGTIDNENNIITRIKGKLIVPKYFFCALLLKNSLGYRAIGFWMENENKDRRSDKLTKYVKSIDELERLTGIDFFCNLPDDEENKVEAAYSLQAWGMN